MREVIYGPYIVCTEDNVAQKMDGQDWRFLAFLHYREDLEKVDWTKYPETYSAVTHFLPDKDRERLNKKYRITNK
jgi:hypothetical protein